MVEVKKGDLVSLADVKRGESTNGKWMLVNIKAEHGYDKLTLQVENVDEAYSFANKAKVKEILGAKKSAREYPKGSGKWYDTYQVTVVLERLSEADAFATGFAEFTDADDALLPFN